jgi:6-phosphogluconolactonase
MAPRRIIITPNRRALAEAAADRLLSRIQHAKEKPAICLTGGSASAWFYPLLATEPYRIMMPWDRVHWFMGDDRFVPIGDRLSNMGAACRAFLDSVPVPRENIHPIATEMTNPDVAAGQYEVELQRFYGKDRLDPERPLFDVVLMGLGTDGHTASLFPNSPALDETSQWVVGIANPSLEPFVPRVSLTFPTLSSTREMLFLVSGGDKKKIMTRVFSGEDLPASRAHSSGDLVWLVDYAAAPIGS